MTTLRTAAEISMAGGTVASHPIPEMVHPWGKSWSQPKRWDVELDDTHAMMSQASFDKLAEYSTSVPSGVYVGKMWRRQAGGMWFLIWYGTCEDPAQCSINSRKILIV